MKSGKRRIVWITVILLLAVTASLFYNGILLFNNPSYELYPVRGIDVSRYQGDIDWEILSQQNISFAFIKATEGSSHVDQYFQINFENALKTSLRVGTYHFFSFDSSGKTQAENFILNVSKIDELLPPVVDFEFYSGKTMNPPDQHAVRTELNILLNELENHYGKKPIIYATEKTYDMYLSGYYATYDIWIRNILTKPKPLHDQTWVFWQYTNRGRLKGYQGEERFIDISVFNGTRDVFRRYGIFD